MMRLKPLLICASLAFISAITAHIPATVIPASLVDNGLDYRGTRGGTHGTIWQGSAALPVLSESVNFAFDPFRLGYQLSMMQQDLRAFVTASGITMTGSFTLPLVALHTIDPVFTHVRGDVQLSSLSAKFSPDFTCQSVAGRITSSIFKANKGWGFSGPEMQGQLSCSQGALVLTISGKNAVLDLAIHLTLTPKGRLIQSATALTKDPAAVRFLKINQFQKVTRDHLANSYSLNKTYHLR